LVPAPSPASLGGDRHAILEALGRLYPEDLLKKLMFLLNIPLDRRPAATLTHAESCTVVLTWCEAQPGGLTRLESELSYLLPPSDPARRQTLGPPSPETSQALLPMDSLPVRVITKQARKFFRLFDHDDRLHEVSYDLPRLSREEKAQARTTPRDWNE